MIVPANQYEIEALMRAGWRLQHDPTRRNRCWRLWLFPFVDRTNIRIAHGASCLALLRQKKIVVAGPSTRQGLTWYLWAQS